MAQRSTWAFLIEEVLPDIEALTSDHHERWIMLKAQAEVYRKRAESNTRSWRRTKEVPDAGSSQE